MRASINRWLAIIRQYRSWKSANPDAWIQDCANEKTLRAAINLAARSLNNLGKRHKHQYRLKSIVLENFSNKLIDAEEAISKCQNFEELISEVERNKVPGIGQLAVYDTAVRIGAYLRIYPEKVYLHAGTNEGVLKVIKESNGMSVLKSDLPEPFRSSDLSCYELEDLFCIYKRDL